MGGWHSRPDNLMVLFRLVLRSGDRLRPMPEMLDRGSEEH